MLKIENKERLEDALTEYVVEAFEDARKKEDYAIEGVDAALNFLAVLDGDDDIPDLDDDEDSEDEDKDEDNEDDLKKGISDALNDLIHATRELVREAKK